jgi:hypothetical protein
MSTGLDRCLQDFANVLNGASVFAMSAKMLAWSWNLFLRSWVADFYRYSYHTAAKMFAKMFYNFANVQKCLQICNSVQKCLRNKKFFCGGK